MVMQFTPYLRLDQHILEMVDLPQGRSLPEVEMRVCEYLGIEPVFNLGDTVKNIDNNKLQSAQKSIINHANKELDKLKSQK
jgi:hypothetical protein